jgi:hypothetical protein
VDGALGGVDAALDAAEESLAGGEGSGEAKLLRVFVVTFSAIILALEFRIPDFGLGFAEAAELPIGGDDGVDEDGFLRAGGLEAVVIAGFGAVRASGSSPRMTWDSAWMPDLRAFIRAMALPAVVRGPVLFCELRRFASICLRVGINGKSTDGWACARAQDSRRAGEFWGWMSGNG